MNILTGIVRGREITKNKDGTTNKILLQVELTSPDDIQTVEYINHDGEDSSPPDGSLVVVLAISQGYKIAIACDDGILAESVPGEKILYSQLNGEKRTSIIMKTDGSLEMETLSTLGIRESFIKLDSTGIDLNGSTDFAVRFSALEAAFAAFIAHYNLHFHGNVTNGGDQSDPITLKAVIDLLPAKVSSVRLPII
jgi:phage gp45-like